MKECKVSEAKFIHSVTIFLKTDVSEALPEWVSQFYRLRCDAEGIVFPPKSAV